jgi:hypothetical protein
MNFDPQKFFIGLLDFFSILLPGALLTYLLMDELGPVVLGDRYSELAGPEAWAAFLFASYLLGHLVFLLGAWLDEFYDWARRYTLNTQITLLARRGRPLRWPARALVWLVFKRERNLAVDRATRIKQQALGALQAKDAINTFQWCKALLNAERPESLAVYSASRPIPSSSATSQSCCWSCSRRGPFRTNGHPLEFRSCWSGSAGVVAVHGAAQQGHQPGVLVRHHAYGEGRQDRFGEASASRRQPHPRGRRGVPRSSQLR